MTAEELEECRMLILEKIKTSRSAIEDHKVIIGESGNGNSFSDYPIEQSVTGMECEHELMHVQRETKLLNSLMRALGRIEDGTYGVCNVCKKGIPFKRLQSVPHTTQCIECKEKGEKRTGRR